ncbi:MAG: D-alanine-D-alanine ligase [Candidatus Sumerlaeota bacterium]|nr:D-alanine-D-alanine ligase [Candidatus Sumerlaeota bacterium]
MSGDPRKILLLCGGPSAEYVVSLTSARAAAHNLDRHRYLLRVACIEENGEWIIPEEVWSTETPPSRIDKLFDLLDMPELCPTGYLTHRSPAEALARIQQWRPNIVLPIIHGAFGEDGRLQGLLDFFGLPYIGSGVLANALCMDKRRTKDFMSAQGVRVSRHMLFASHTSAEQREDQFAAAGNLLGWPLVVKPNIGGSSLSCGLARDADELRNLVHRAFDADTEVLVEQYVSGREVTCGVLDLAESFGGRIVCPPTEIRPRASRFFDFDAKYRPGASDEITPPDMPETVINRIQAVAEKAHDLLGCNGMSRSDMIVDADGQPVFLETNTIPGLTPTSLLPQGAAALGINMTTLLTGMIEGVFQRLVETRTRRGAL